MLSSGVVVSLQDWYVDDIFDAHVIKYFLSFHILA